MTIAESNQAGTRRRLWWVSIVAVAATIAVVIAVTVVVRTNGAGAEGAATEENNTRTDAAEPASVQDLLHYAADQLEADGGEVVDPDEDQWLYRRVGSAFGPRTEVEEAQETWVSFRDQQSDPSWIDPAYFEGPGEIYRIYRDLPDETAAVVDRIYDLSDRVPRDSGLFNGRPDPYVAKQPWVQHLQAFAIVGELLSYGDPPPAVQAKLYRALAEIPGIVDDGLVDDAIDDQLTDGHSEQFRVIRWDWDFDSIDWPDDLVYGEDWGLNAHRQIAIDPETYYFRALRWQDDFQDDDYQPARLDVAFDIAIVDAEGQRP